MAESLICLTDCTDTNAVARLATRLSALLGRQAQILPLDGTRPELMAAMTLVDVLAATRLTGGSPIRCTALINIAPRDDESPNGLPFCYFMVDTNLIVTTMNPELLSFAGRHLGVTAVSVTDVRMAMEAAASWAAFSVSEVEAIINSQFRSLWFMPLLTKWIQEGRPIPARQEPIIEVFDKHVVAVVDNFGNCKTTCLPEDAGFIVGARLKVRSPQGIREITCYERLVDVPRGEAGLTIGSSGHGFIELVVNGASAAAIFGMDAGDTVFEN